MNPDELPEGVDPARPSPARIYDYLLGGRDNLEIDRATAESLLQVEPDLRDLVWANRGFLQRATSWLASQGIDQFVDIGAGLPTQNNTHDAARRVVPDARVVYVDNDPMAVSQGRALIADIDRPELTAYIAGEFRDPETLMGDRDLRALIDLDRPVGLLLVALLHFVPDAEDPIGLIHRYLAMVPSGSYVAISHATTDHRSPERVEEAKRVYSAATNTMSMRTRAEFTAFFDGLEIVRPYAGAAPDVTYVSLWGAEDPELADSDGARMGYCAVARKP